MTDWDITGWEEPEPDEATFMSGRQEGRTYYSKSFTLPRPGSADDGQPARFMYKVFDDDGGEEAVIEADGTSWGIHRSEAGHAQVKLLLARESTHVKDLWIQRLRDTKNGLQCYTVLHLNSPEAEALIDALRNLDYVPMDGSELTVRVDDALVRQVFSDPTALVSAYDADPETIRQVIAGNVNARDVIAVANRRAALDRFHRLLEDVDFFDSEKERLGTVGREGVWQDFFEENSWILGVGLTGQLLTSWNDDKLEQVVAGSSIAGVGKRADGLLRTAGIISSMVFAEFKHHQTPLLGTEYRSGCWSASDELAGGIAQCQGTVHRATREIGERICTRDDDGNEIAGDFTYLVQPRSFLVIGSLSEFRGQRGGDNPDKIQSFQLLRSNTHSPEIITFDELLARAEWMTERATDSASEEDDI